MEGRGGGGGLINFPPLKRGGLLERGGLFERGGLNRGFTVVLQKLIFPVYYLKSHITLFVRKKSKNILF